MAGDRPTALVTGASAGIGAAFCRALAADGYDLVLTARRRDRLEDLGAELEERHKTAVTVLPADLADPRAPLQLFEQIAEKRLAIDVLVNNAGYGQRESFLEVDWKVHADFIQVLVTSVVQLCHLFIPAMRQRGFGRVINVASVAAFTPSALGFTLYGAAKVFVVKFSEALWLELRDTGVHVTAVCPGLTYSEFHDVLGVRKAMSRIPSFMWMDADTVARKGIEAVMRGEPMYVNGAVNRLIVGGARHFPYRLMLSGAKWGSGRVLKAR